MAAAVAEAAMSRVLSTTSAQTDGSQPALTSQEGATSSSQASAQGEIKGHDASAYEARGDGAEPASHGVELDADQVGMRLALDVLWTGSGSGAAQPLTQAAGGTVGQQ